MVVLLPGVGLVLVAWRWLDIAARPFWLHRRWQRLAGGVQVRREGWARRYDRGFNAFQVDCVRLVVVRAVAVAVDLVDDVSEAGAAVADEKDGNDDEKSEVHCRVLFIGQRLCCRQTSLCHFCTQDTYNIRKTQVRHLRFLQRVNIIACCAERCRPTI